MNADQNKDFVFLLVIITLGAQLLFDCILKRIPIEKAQKTCLSFLFQVVSWYYVLRVGVFQIHSSEVFSSFQNRFYFLLLCVFLPLLLALRTQRLSLLDFSSKEELEQAEKEKREKLLKAHTLLNESRSAYIKHTFKEFYSSARIKYSLMLLAFILFVYMFLL